jgi:hypothetical protein
MIKIKRHKPSIFETKGSGFFYAHRALTGGLPGLRAISGGYFINKHLPTAISAISVFGISPWSLKKREGVTKCTPLFRPSAKCQLNIRQMMVVALAERIYEH